MRIREFAKTICKGDKGDATLLKRALEIRDTINICLVNQGFYHLEIIII